MTAHELSRAQREMLAGGIAELGLDIAPTALDAIEAHLALVQKWRDRINLVSIRNDRELITHHALDSLSLLPLLESSARVLDLGTGAGFPGMLLAAARPDMEFTLLDSRQRRIEFLRLVNAALGLKNVSMVCSRMEDFPAGQISADSRQSGVQPGANFDTLLARAVASLEALVSMTAPLRQPGQRLIAMKGLYPHEELVELKNRYADQIVSIRVEPLEVPWLEASRHAVIIEY